MRVWIEMMRSCAICVYVREEREIGDRFVDDNDDGRL